MNGKPRKQWSNRTWWWIRYAVGFATAILVETTWHVLERHGWLLGSVIILASGLGVNALLIAGRNSLRRAAQEDTDAGR